MIHLGSLRDLRHLLDNELEVHVLVCCHWNRCLTRNLEELSDFCASLPRLTIFTLGVNSDSFEEEEELEEIEEFAIASGCSSLPSLLTFLSGEVRRVRPVQGISSFKRAVWSMLREAPSLPASVLASGASRLGLLFLAGDRSGAGKTSVSLGILSSLLEAGLHPRQIAYIKPATQCEGEQPIRAWCQENDVDCVDIGPVVFYKGFTREFLAGNEGSSLDLLSTIREAVYGLLEAPQRKIVIVDGVGYPAVGSICGISNASVASFLGAPVLLVGKKGVGDAVDSFNLNRSFFEYNSVPVLGTVFNKLPLEGYYSMALSSGAIEAYFGQFQPQYGLYGFFPEVPLIEVEEEEEEEGMDSMKRQRLNEQGEDVRTKRRVFDRAGFLSMFSEQFDVDRLLADLYQYQLRGKYDHLDTSFAPPPPSSSSSQSFTTMAIHSQRSQRSQRNQRSQRSQRSTALLTTPSRQPMASNKKRSREEVEREVVSLGGCVSGG